MLKSDLRTLKVAVILLNYDDYADRFLTECYESLQKQSYPLDSFKLFIVNNAAIPSGKALIERLAKTASVLDNPENMGWAAGNNQAIAEALRQGFEYIVLLNIDTVADKRWLEELVKEAEASEAHIIQSKILLFGSDRINSLGNHTHFLGYSYCYGYGKKEPSIKPEPMHFASGASMLVKREVFDRVGLFREEYFLYYEDMEFCWRARLAGFNLRLADRSICYHKYDFRNKMSFLYLFEKNRLLTMLTLQKKRTLLLILPCLFMAQIFSGLYFLVTGHGKSQWKLLLYFLKISTWRHILRTRRQVCRLRLRNDRELVKCYKGKIVFAEIRVPFFNLIINPLLSAYWAVARRLIVW